jgi:CheY-like chemotaxis protein
VDLPGNTRLSLDHLLNSLLDIPNPCAIVVLSGMLTDSDGLAGLTKAHALGITLTGSLEANTPVFDMIEQLQKLGLMGELYAPKQLLEHMRFRVPGLKHAARRDGLIEAPRILIADDEEKVRTQLSDMLKTHGMTVDFAGDGLDAVRKLQKCKYDALLLDLQLPELDGLKILEALKTIDPELAIILMTNPDAQAMVLAAKEFKVQGMLQKPYSWEKLKKLLPNSCQDSLNTSYQ